MKYFALAVTAAFLVSCSGASEEEVVVETPQEVVEVVGDSEANYYISGMTCLMGCKATIEKKVNAVAGVDTFGIAFEDSTAYLKFDSKITSADEIREVINGVNSGAYTATLN